MRAPPTPPAAMAADLRSLHDDIEGYCNRSLLLHAYDMSAPGREEELPDDQGDGA